MPKPPLATPKPSFPPRFAYGAAINALFVFLLVLAFTYFGIMRPLQHFTNLWYPNRWVG
jgi:hypothetical protein